MSSGICRWGIVSTAQIARKNWQAIQLSGNGIVSAVASRDRDKAARFIADCQSGAAFDSVPRACGSYEELIDDPDIDAVYIPLPTGLRKPLVIRAAKAGKHVLCEKPCAINSADLQEMISACEENGVQFMDGIMFMHSRRLQRIREAIDSGAIGELRRVVAQFSFYAPQELRQTNIRTDSLMEPFGCLGDLGWYNLRFAIWVARCLPVSVSARMIQGLRREGSPAAVPMQFSAEMTFPDGMTGGTYSSFETGNQQWANISGTEGHIHICDYVLPFANLDQSTPEIDFVVTRSSFEQEGCDFSMHENVQRHAVNEPSHSHLHSQETSQFRNFAAIVQSGQVDRSWHRYALETQRLLDACWQSAQDEGNVFELESE